MFRRRLRRRTCKEAKRGYGKLPEADVKRSEESRRPRGLCGGMAVCSLGAFVVYDSLRAPHALQACAVLACSPPRYQIRTPPERPRLVGPQLPTHV
eukprot:6037023-Alexandrium_andersonii.AAC.1